MAKDAGTLFKDISFIFKLVEVILGIVGTIFIGHGMSYYSRMVAHVIIGTVIGYLIICLAYFIAKIFDGDQGKLFALLIHITGGVLNCVSGIFCFMSYADSSYIGTEGRASISISQPSSKKRDTALLVLALTTIACGVLLIIDFVLLLKK